MIINYSGKLLHENCYSYHFSIMLKLFQTLPQNLEGQKKADSLYLAFGLERVKIPNKVKAV